MYKKLLTFGAIVASTTPLIASISCSKEEIQKNIEKYKIYFDEKENMVSIDISPVTRDVVKSQEFKDEFQKIKTNAKIANATLSEVQKNMNEIDNKYFKNIFAELLEAKDVEKSISFFKKYSEKVIHEFEMHPNAIGVIFIDTKILYDENDHKLFVSHDRNYNRFYSQEKSGMDIGRIDRDDQLMRNGKIVSNYWHNNEILHWKDLDLVAATKYSAKHCISRINKEKSIMNDASKNKEEKTRASFIIKLDESMLSWRTPLIIVGDLY